MKKLIALSLLWFALAFSGCENKTTPSGPGGAPSEPPPGQAPGQR
jgi:hypothetical protein